MYSIACAENHFKIYCLKGLQPTLADIGVRYTLDRLPVHHSAEIQRQQLFRLKIIHTGNLSPVQNRDSQLCVCVCVCVCVYVWVRDFFKFHFIYLYFNLQILFLFNWFSMLWQHSSHNIHVNKAILNWTELRERKRERKRERERERERESRSTRRWSHRLHALWS